MHKFNVNYTLEFNYNALNATEIKDSQKKIRNFDDKELIIQKISEAKNTLESYIYKLEDSL